MYSYARTASMKPTVSKVTKTGLTLSWKLEDLAALPEVLLFLQEVQKQAVKFMSQVKALPPSKVEVLTESPAYIAKESAIEIRVTLDTLDKKLLPEALANLKTLIVNL